MNDFLKNFLLNNKTTIIPLSIQYNIISELNELIKYSFEKNSWIVGSDFRKTIWERAWSSNILIENGISIPQYLNNNIYRIDGNYCEASQDKFELLFSNELIEFIFRNFKLRNESVIEFGAGSGKNLIYLKQKDLINYAVGTDWVNSAVELIKKNGNSLGITIDSYMFDYNNPSLIFSNMHDFIFYTHHSLEQVGANYLKFINFILQVKPKLIINIEPFNETYGENDFDRIALFYHRSRNYLVGYHSYIKLLEKYGIIDILCDYKINFGSKFHDAYNILIWKVK